VKVSPRCADGVTVTTMAGGWRLVSVTQHKPSSICGATGVIALN